MHFGNVPDLFGDPSGMCFGLFCIGLPREQRHAIKDSHRDVHCFNVRDGRFQVVHNELGRPSVIKLCAEGALAEIVVFRRKGATSTEQQGDDQ